MSAQPVLQPQPHNEQLQKKAAKLASPYCSDPNCKYCKELRAVEELVSSNENLSGG